jgi:hypothetical protein
MDGLRERLTYANVTATIALVAALGGGTAVALDKINADSVNGVSVARINFEKDMKLAPQPFTTIFRGRGLALQARCYEQSGTFLDERAKSLQNNSEIQVAVNGINQGNPDTEFVKDDDFDNGETLDIPETIQADDTLITLAFSSSDGAHVTAVLQREVAHALGDTKDCLIGGHALFSG